MTISLLEERARNRFCLISGVFAALFYFGGLAVAGFLPPHAAFLEAEQISAFYVDNNLQIKAGMAMAMFGVSFLLPLIGAVSASMAKAEKSLHFFSNTQLACGVISVVGFIVPLFIWMTAAFRIDRDPELILLLNDLGWLTVLTPYGPFSVQIASVAICGLLDRRDVPLLPRWICFMGLWAALGGIAGALIPFFTQGVFAWHNLFGFYVPMVCINAWFLVLLVHLWKKPSYREPSEVMAV